MTNNARKNYLRLLRFEKNVYYDFFRKYLDFDARPVTEPTGAEAGL
jgi:hypothetical protein